MKLKEKVSHSSASMAFIFSFQFISIVAFSQQTETSTLSDLSRMLEQDYADDFAFSVKVQINGELLLSESFGYLDKDRQEPTDERTLFNIASITKSITAVGIMRLVELNKLRLSNTLDQFFDHVPETKKMITVSTLLAHQSGLRQSYPLEGIADAEEALQIVLDEKLAFEPNSHFLYSNQNYQLLALIIERVTQVSYEDFIRNEVLVPLKMNDTYFWKEVSEEQNVANLNRKISRQLGQRSWGWVGATGTFSTSSDLLKFWNGIRDAELLSKESYDILFDNYFETQSGLQIGYGFFKTPKTKWNTLEIWTRGTESWGHNSVIRYFPAKNATIVVSTNSGEFGKNKSTGNKIISDIIANYLFE